MQEPGADDAQIPTLRLMAVQAETEPSHLLVHMRLSPGWSASLKRFRSWAESEPEPGPEAAYGEHYARRRAAMIFDVVASHRRRYKSVVVPLVAKFDAAWPELGITDLANGEPCSGFGLPTARWATITGVAQGLVGYRTDRGLADTPDDELVRHWASATEAVRFAPRLDPYVGAVSGIGPALFAYMRMRSGVDAIKPDVRVRKRLGVLGFPAPTAESALLLVCEALAEELGISLMRLDRMLWAD